jgi:hypothetical protein
MRSENWRVLYGLEGWARGTAVERGGACGAQAFPARRNLLSSRAHPPGTRPARAQPGGGTLMNSPNLLQGES